MFGSKTLQCVLAGALLLFGGACEEEGGLSAPSPLGPVTNQQVSDYGNRLLDALHSCDVEKLATVYDIESSLAIALRKSSLNNHLQHQYFEATRISGPQQIGDLVNCRDGEYAKGFVVEGVGELDGKPSVIISNFTDGAVLWEFPVGMSTSGHPIARDFYDYSQGILITTALADYNDLIAGDVFSTTVSGVCDDLLRGEPASLERLSELTQVSRANRRIQVSALQIRAFLGAEQYSTAKAEFDKRFPKHGKMHLLTQGALANAGDGVGALAAIDALEEQLGVKVPGLDFLRLEAHNAMGASLLDAAKHAVQTMPERPNAWYWLLEAHHNVNDYEGMFATMKEMGERFGTIWDRKAAGDEFFLAYAASPQWEAYHAWVSETFEQDVEVEVAPTNDL